jgi:hypothetical protein
VVVRGGLVNQASDVYAAIAGGCANRAGIGSPPRCSELVGEEVVSGGASNQAKAIAASISGGSQNTAAREGSSVSGGAGNTADDELVSILGGNGEQLGDGNGDDDGESEAGPTVFGP